MFLYGAYDNKYFESRILNLTTTEELIFIMQWTLAFKVIYLDWCHCATKAQWHTMIPVMVESIKALKHSIKIYIVVLQTDTSHFPDISKKIEIPAANITSHTAVRARYVLLRFSAMSVTLID